MFDSVLIANRGEIACRVIRTARRLGLRTVAVYSDADANARHVAMADAAHRIGPPAARESYLRSGAIIAAAKAAGAKAIHPGYGFLSENAAFAEACAKAHITFIGPPPDAIRAMGLKGAAKALMEKAKVPVVPGYHGDDQSLATLQREAARIGYPVLIKAVAGGGGKGMRRVDSEAEFERALTGAKREAASAFGDDKVLIEKYLVKPRHIEIQVFADAHGNAVHLFERDCSIQRRHQKVIEEAPAPGMPPAMREAMGQAAVAAAKAIGYVGAGTVEFIADVSDGLRPDRFYFMEMNTRLQVEHPVTEMITGQDLVEWQIRVAAGEKLPLQQDEIRLEGHAVEVRLYAENPTRNFLPSTGTLVRFRAPPEGPHLRLDTGVREGDEVTPYYDPMIAKLIVHDRDRRAALRRLRQALHETEIVGPANNVAFLAQVAGHAAFLDGDLDTGFIDRHKADLIPRAEEVSADTLALAAVALLLQRAESTGAARRASGDPHSPWGLADGWRLNGAYEEHLELMAGEALHSIGVLPEGAGWRLAIHGASIFATGTLDDGSLIATLDGCQRRVGVVRRDDRIIVLERGHGTTLALHDPLDVGEVEEGAGGAIAAPLPGKVIQVLVTVGEKVEKGKPLLVLEAMKMEHTIAAAGAGTVEAVHVAAGDQVAEGAALIALKEAEA